MWSVDCFIFRVGSEQADNTDWVGKGEIQLRKCQKEKRGEISERTNSSRRIDDEKEREERVDYTWLVGWLHVWLVNQRFLCWLVGWGLLTKPYLSWCRLARDLGEILLERATGWIYSTVVCVF